MTGMQRLNELKDKRRLKHICICFIIIYVLGVIISYKYFATMEDIRNKNIELYEDYSTPNFKTVIEEIFN